MCNNLYCVDFFMFQYDPDGGEMSVSVASGDFPEEVHKE